MMYLCTIVTVKTSALKLPTMALVWSFTLFWYDVFNTELLLCIIISIYLNILWRGIAPGCLLLSDCLFLWNTTKQCFFLLPVLIDGEFHLCTISTAAAFCHPYSGINSRWPVFANSDCELLGQIGAIDTCLCLPMSRFNKQLSCQSWCMPVKTGLYLLPTEKGCKPSSWNANTN